MLSNPRGFLKFFLRFQFSTYLYSFPLFQNYSHHPIYSSFFYHPACNQFLPKLKNLFITFINCFNKIVLQKLDKAWESWKRSKVSWMGHVWGLHGGTWKMGAWGWNIAPKSLHLVGDTFQGLSYPDIETHLGPPVETCHVLMSGRFWGLCLEVCDFQATQTEKRSPPKHDMFLFWFA
jgi:hypothetical protein